jgi:hypothetical protein
MVELEGYSDPILVDYLASIIGVESKAIEKSAVVVEYEGEELRVLHPCQLLQAKIWNLYRLTNKRTEEGIEQARLAIEIVAAFIENADMDQRELLNVIEVIGKFAATTPARFAKQYGLDCLQAMPKYVFNDGVLPPLFRTKRWPQLVAATA